MPCTQKIVQLLGFQKKTKVLIALFSNMSFSVPPILILRLILRNTILLVFSFLSIKKQIVSAVTRNNHTNSKK